MRFIALAVLLCVPMVTAADWHFGKISHIGIAYDGTTVTIALEGWQRNNCTCYAPWPNRMCLDDSRATNKFEESFILAAWTKRTEINVNIDETTCRVVALYEDAQ